MSPTVMSLHCHILLTVMRDSHLVVENDAPLHDGLQLLVLLDGPGSLHLQPVQGDRPALPAVAALVRRGQSLDNGDQCVKLARLDVEEELVQIHVNLFKFLRETKTVDLVEAQNNFL